MARGWEPQDTYRWPLQAGKDEEMDSPRELPEGTQSCQYLDFSPEKLILGF